MTGEVYDVVVVGAGVEGSAAAYYLAKRGKKRLLLEQEQFPLPHTRGSSHGQSRITRNAYPQDFHTEMTLEASEVIIYNHMIREAKQEWQDLEEEAGWEVFRQTGYLSIGQYRGTFLEGNANYLRSKNADFDYMTPTEFRQRYPMISFPEDYSGIVDRDAGILKADKSLRAYLTMYQKYGGHLVDGAMVTNIKRGLIVSLETPSATYRGRSVILCPGPWVNKILRPLGFQLPLEAVRFTVCYWRELKPGAYDTTNFQPFYERGLGHVFYGAPSFEYPGHVKICLHGGPIIDPDLRDQADDKWVIDVAKGYVRDHFPWLDPLPSIVDTCIYTKSPDKHPVLDYIHGSRNIVLGAGFSGHGFKLAPVVGKLLGQLACDEAPSYCLTPFRIDRFHQHAKL